MSELSGHQGSSGQAAVLTNLHVRLGTLREGAFGQLQPALVALHRVFPSSRRAARTGVRIGVRIGVVIGVGVGRGCSIRCAAPGIIIASGITAPPPTTLIAAGVITASAAIVTGGGRGTGGGGCPAALILPQQLDARCTGISKGLPLKEKPRGTDARGPLEPVRNREKFPVSLTPVPPLACDRPPHIGILVSGGIGGRSHCCGGRSTVDTRGRPDCARARRVGVGGPGATASSILLSQRERKRSGRRYYCCYYYLSGATLRRSAWTTTWSVIRTPTGLVDLLADLGFASLLGPMPGPAHCRHQTSTALIAAGSLRRH